MTAFFDSVQQNLFGHTAFIQSRTPGMLTRDLGGALLVDSGLESDTFNKVLWQCTPRFTVVPTNIEASKACFEAARTHFTSDTTDSDPLAGRFFSFWAGGTENLTEMDRSCSEVGWQTVETETAMALPLSCLSRTEKRHSRAMEGIRFLPVRDETSLRAFISVLAANWTPPDADVSAFYQAAMPLLLSEGVPMRLFIGLAGDKAVSCGELFLSEQNHIAGLHMICTLETFRRRGLGRAMTALLLNAGQRAGATAAVLLASAEGEPVYRRLGFEACGVFKEYAPGREIPF